MNTHKKGTRSEWLEARLKLSVVMKLSSCTENCHEFRLTGIQ